MKRTYTVNIDGQIFNIDDDAYSLLQNYLEQLHAAFTGSEGAEIVSDIESRIREHFVESISDGHNVIGIDDVSEVIKTMGRPEEICGDEALGESETPPPYVNNQVNNGRKFYRNMKDKVFGGVIGGLATYMNWNSSIARLLFILLFFSSLFVSISGTFLIIGYLVLWMVIPPALTPKQILEMNGESVSVQNMGKTVLGEETHEIQNDSTFTNFLNAVLGISGKVIMAFVAFFAVVSCIAALFVFVFVCTALLLYISGVSYEALQMLNIHISNCGQVTLMPAVCVIAWSFFAFLVFVSLIWASSVVLFHAKTPSKIAKWIMAIIVLLVFIASVSLTACCYSI